MRVLGKGKLEPVRLKLKEIEKGGKRRRGIDPLLFGGSTMRAVYAVAVSFALGAVAAQAADPETPSRVPRSGPDIGYDYERVIANHIDLVATGKADEAVGLLEKLGPVMLSDTLRQEWKRRYAFVYGGAGRYEGFELTGYRRLSSRDYKFYAVAHFERGPVQFGYVFHKIGSDWKVIGFSISDQIDEMEKLHPLQPIGGSQK